MIFERKVKDGGKYDVIVCGAGPGGTGAAIAAARMGKKVLLMDAAGCIGGYWTGGLMGISLDMPGKGGIPLEIMTALMKKNKAQWADRESYTYDIEAMKCLLDSMVMDAGVDVLLYSRITDVKVENGRIAAILADGMTSMAFTADWFVDGTGHGRLGQLAGCSFEMGNADGRTQPGSLESMVAGVPLDKWKSDIHNESVKLKFKAMLLEHGVDSTYPKPLLFRLSPGGVTHKLAVNHQYGVTADDDFALSRATMEARREINRAADALATQAGWQDFTLVQTAEQLGLRDARRIRGHYTVTIWDALEGVRFADGVAPVHYPLDVHNLMPDYKPEEANADAGTGYVIKPFDVPFRSLAAADVENLFMVGRCISGDFLAHSAYRMTTTACAMGEGVGIAAAGLMPGQKNSDADGAAVHAELIRRGYDYTV